jgi:ubiquinone/menaquinone biosynthesis C-methylase UbiE
MGTGNIIHADINDEMIETMRKHLSDEELFSNIVQHVQGFIR